MAGIVASLGGIVVIVDVFIGAVDRDLVRIFVAQPAEGEL